MNESHHDGRDEEEGSHLDQRMKSPVKELLEQFLARDAEPGNEEDDCHRAVEDAILGPDDAAMFGYVWEVVGQDAHDADANKEPLMEDEEGGRFEDLLPGPSGAAGPQVVDWIHDNDPLNHGYD